ncbi:HAD-IC family P-type ATPase [Candidatus Woesearchaeota archaeon]|nr:HAD-IC family P-type ATPase [Candidatus Woesearchaeota archaeon]
MEKEEWHLLSLPEAYRKLGSSEKGLSAKDAVERLKGGANVFSEEKHASWLTILTTQFSFVVLILIFSAGVSFWTGDTVEAVVIFIIVALIVALGFFQEFRAGREMEALKNLTPRRAKVLRDGKAVELEAREIVPGDVLLLERGNLVPADARLLSCNGLECDESALTGESTAVAKATATLSGSKAVSEQSNLVFAGTQVTSGNALALVVRTGRETEIGKVSTLLRDIGVDETPLQKKLKKLSKILSYIVLGICVIIFMVGLYHGQRMADALLLAVAVAVSGIPEGLPTIIAITLALGVKRMARRNVIIKRLPAVETLGTCTVICSDKTGTLTQNKMVVEKIFLSDKEFSISGQGFEPKGFFFFEGKKVDPRKHAGLTKIFEIGVLCNNSELTRREQDWAIDGEPTEGAFIVLAKKAGIEKGALHRKHPRIKEHPFDPVRKCMSTVHLVEKQPMVYSKGAPEVLLKKATHFFEDGTVKKMTSHAREMFLAKNEAYASQGMRVLGLAFKKHLSKRLELEHVESELVFTGLVAMRDPPGPNAKKSVELCKQAGTKVVMITGDNKITAQAIARDLGIWTEGDLILVGGELDKIDDERFLRMVERVTIYARTTPKHKLRIVDALQRKGHIVAMTGDGVNDAPALKKADIGIAMGKRGTDVAKEAAEMVIKDDNFSTIVVAIEEGRNIYSNIQKFMYYFLACNITEVMMIFIAIVLGMNPPLTALMILFINLIVGDFPALGLAVESSPAAIMHERPRSPKENVLSDYLMLKIAQVVPLMLLGTLGLYVWMIFQGAGLAKAQTVAFTALVFFELFHVFNAKAWHDSVFSLKTLQNVSINGGIIFSTLFLFLAIYLPPANLIFGTVPLSGKEFLIILAVAFTIVIVTEIQKTAINAEIRERERMLVKSG